MESRLDKTPDFEELELDEAPDVLPEVTVLPVLAVDQLGDPAADVVVAAVQPARDLTVVQKEPQDNPLPETSVRITLGSY